MRSIVQLVERSMESTYMIPAELFNYRCTTAVSEFQLPCLEVSAAAAWWFGRRLEGFEGWVLQLSHPAEPIEVGRV